MSDEAPRTLAGRAAEVKVSVSTLIQAAITVVVGYLLQMVLGMDAKVARLEEQIRAQQREAQLHAEHSREVTEAAEKSHTAMWDAIRRKADRR